MDSSPWEPSPTEPPHANDLAARPASPFVDRDPPRLGILHLIVLTTCVAAYLGSIRAWSLVVAEQNWMAPPGAYEVAAGTLHYIGGGAAWAGLLLWGARRLRGWPFPTLPGEFLLAITAVAVGVQNALWPVWWLILTSQRYQLAMVLSLGCWVVQAGIWLWAWVRLKKRRWRAFLLAMPACYLLRTVILISGTRVGFRPFGPAADLGGRLILIGVLAVVLLKDHVDGIRYPWTHWYGVATRAWLDAASIAVGLWWLLIERPGF